MFCIRIIKATPTGLEPATFAVTGRRSKPTELRSHIPPRIPSELWSGVLQCNQTIVSVNRSLSENAPTGPSNRQTQQSHGQSVQPLKSFSRHIKRTPGCDLGFAPRDVDCGQAVVVPFSACSKSVGFSSRKWQATTWWGFRFAGHSPGMELRHSSGLPRAAYTGHRG